MLNLNFLKNAKLAEAATQTRRSGESTVKYPENGADIRVYKSGAIYPSPEFAAKYNLDFGKRDANDKPVNNGLDVIDSRHWAQAATLPQAVVFVAAVARAQGQTDLFSTVGYDKETGEPLSTVLTQGAQTAGKELLALLEEVYGITMDEEKGFIDLMVADDRQGFDPLQTSNGIYYIPKKVSRGAKAGEYQYIRRENISVFALVPFQTLAGSDAAAEETAGQYGNDDASGTALASAAEGQETEVAGPVMEHEKL